MSETIDSIFGRGLLALAFVTISCTIGLLFIVLSDECVDYPILSTIEGAGALWVFVATFVSGVAGVFLVVASIFLLGAATSAVLRVLKLIAEA